MKKLFALFIIFILVCLPTWAEHKPIPKELSKQYKEEIEQLIDKKYYETINNIDEYYNIATEYYNDFLSNGYNIEKHISMVNLAEITLPAADLELYSELTKLTQEKYLGIKYLPIGTDTILPFNEFLYPYFKENKVNTRKLTSIAKYENKKIKLVEKYLRVIQKSISNKN